MSEDLRDPDWSPVLPFADPFDRALARTGPPGLFTLDPKGQLRLAATRSRDQTKRATAPLHHEPCHCLFRDTATGWVQYILVTSPALCDTHPRAEIRRFSDQPSALSALRSLGTLPVCDALPDPSATPLRSP